MLKIRDLYPHYIGFTNFENPNEQVKKKDHKKAVYGDSMQSIAVLTPTGQGIYIHMQIKKPISSLIHLTSLFVDFVNEYISGLNVQSKFTKAGIRFLSKIQLSSQNTPLELLTVSPRYFHVMCNAKYLLLSVIIFLIHNIRLAVY